MTMRWTRRSSFLAASKSRSSSAGFRFFAAVIFQELSARLNLSPSFGLLVHVQDRFGHGRTFSFDHSLATNRPDMISIANTGDGDGITLVGQPSQINPSFEIQCFPHRSVS